MPTSQNPHSGSNFSATQRNLRRLFLFRSISLGLQMFTIFVAMRWLSLPLPTLPLAAILITHTLWNVFTAWRALQPRPVSDAEYLLQLLTDVLALSGVFYFTGGASNPFVGFYLLPIMIAATVLPKHYVWTMTAITTVCYTILMNRYLPLAASEHMQHDSGFNQHVFGMWFSFVFSAALVSYFVTNMAQALRERDRSLAASREQALRDENLVALGTLAAGAAHELGTPLNTMAIVTDELKADFPPDKAPELNDQLSVISEQVKRCKAALSVISASAGELRADAGEALPLKPYLQNLLERWQAERPSTPLHQKLDGSQPMPLLITDLALEQAITNILNNAADASPQWVAFHAHWRPQQLSIEIRDRGPGISPHAEPHLGKTPYSDKHHGLGLGLYLAHSVIGRLGGEVHVFSDHQGSCALIRLPLLESGR